MFQLDRRLASSAVLIGRTALNQVRLQCDARYPWIVLIPERPDLKELHQLEPQDFQTLMGEALIAGNAVRAAGQALGRPVEKLNLGALGNVVSQLHLHVVGRRTDDPAWPGPVWGFGDAAPYEAEALDAATAAVRGVFGPVLRP